MDTKLYKVMRIIVHFSGIVQGVGMRYFIQQIALGFHLTGYVKNLPDGRVEALLEGEEAKLEQAIAKMRNGPRAATIKDITMQPLEAAPQNNDFRVAF